MIDPGPGLDSHIEKILAGEGPDPLDPVHPYAPGPLARRGEAEGGDRRAGPRPAGARGPGRDLRARPRARARRAHRPRRHHAARDPHAGARLEPPLLPARGDADAVHRRPRDAGLDGGDQPARRRHARLPRSLEALLGEDLAIIAPGPRLPDRRAAPGAAPPDRAPPGARAKVVARARASSRAASLEELLPLVYDDVPAAHPRRGGALAHRAPRQAGRRRRGARRRRPLRAGTIDVEQEDAR